MHGLRIRIHSILAVDRVKSRYNYLLSPRHTQYSGVGAENERMGIREPNKQKP